MYRSNKSGGWRPQVLSIGKQTHAQCAEGIIDYIAETAGSHKQDNNKLVLVEYNTGRHLFLHNKFFLFTLQIASH